jgi:predicted outer membrane repeat protein
VGWAFSGNSASDSGGAIYNLATATIQDCVLSSNTAANFGGGIYNGASGTLTLDDSIVHGNTAPPGAGADLFNLGAFSSNDNIIGVIAP